jgi:hypothetical protein
MTREVSYWFKLRPSRNRAAQVAPATAVGLCDRRRGEPAGAACGCEQDRRARIGAGLGSISAVVSGAGGIARPRHRRRQAYLSARRT